MRSVAPTSPPCATPNRRGKLNPVMSASGVDMQFRAFLLDPTSDRAEVIAGIEHALALANAELGLTFENDGSDSEDGAVRTVWTDDPHGKTETSWIRLTDDESAGSLCLEVNATTEAILERTCANLSSHAPVVQIVSHAPRPF